MVSRRSLLTASVCTNTYNASPESPVNCQDWGKDTVGIKMEGLLLARWVWFQVSLDRGDSKRGSAITTLLVEENKELASWTDKHVTASVSQKITPVSETNCQQ